MLLQHASFLIGTAAFRRGRLLLEHILPVGVAGWVSIVSKSPCSFPLPVGRRVRYDTTLIQRLTA
jgi:hypothetical protein